MFEYLINKYGIRMNIDELSTELKVPANTFKSRSSKVRSNLKIYRDGKRIYANTNDVADYLSKLSDK